MSMRVCADTDTLHSRHVETRILYCATPGLEEVLCPAGKYIFMNMMHKLIS